MSEKLQDINTKTGNLDAPTASKGRIQFGFPAADGQKAIIKNGSSLDIFVRADKDDTIALAFPNSSGNEMLEGKHIIAGHAESYNLTKGATQLSIVATGTATGMVSVSIGDGA